MIDVDTDIIFKSDLLDYYAKRYCKIMNIKLTKKNREEIFNLIKSHLAVRFACDEHYPF
jgi:hypothetical protein